MVWELIIVKSRLWQNNSGVILIHCHLFILDYQLGQINKISGWEPVIRKFTKRLSDWKTRMMLIGGRLTLVKSVLNSLPLYFFSLFRAPSCVIKKLESVRRNFFWAGSGNDSNISWVKWEEVLLPYGEGGLNLGSLKRKNLALIGKWWWRFLTEPTTLWVKVISSIYGPSGGFDLDRKYKLITCNSTWANIIKAGEHIDSIGVSFKDSFSTSIGDGCNTRFWSDNWVGSSTLKNRFGRLFRLDQDPNAMVKDRINRNGCGLWEWICDPARQTRGQFQELCDLIAVEVFVWRTRKKRIPSLIELDKRGIDLHTVRCLLCDDDVESVDHAILFYKHAFDVWSKVFDWWGLNMAPSLSINEMFTASPSIAMSEVGSMVWQAMIWTCVYLIWWNRNQKVYNNKCWTPPVALC
ncbi:uncharacterized protein [Rutidosis leptorrhynchoides]|uniref:uncharacterized protein n=1 Tax=Rutidosis leptorrhynchoides TaxID=125765 RepID=UPI003A9A19F1